jgi:hypothetical protein
MAIRLKLVDKLKAENERLKAENNALRDAADDGGAHSRYAKDENWRKQEINMPDLQATNWVWKGDGDGPKTAKYFLGLEEEKN